MTNVEWHPQESRHNSHSHTTHSHSTKHQDTTAILHHILRELRKYHPYIQDA